MDKIRDGFEAWMKKEMPNEPLELIAQSGIYNGGYAQSLWIGWQAALSAVPANHIGDSNEMAEPLRDAIASCLTSVYVCTRVWSAWSYGTMSQDDFIEASETEFLDDLVDVVMSAMQSQAQQPAQEPTEPKPSQRLIDTFQELNMGNYGDDDVRQLNDWAIEAYTALAATAQEPIYRSVDEARALALNYETPARLPLFTAFEMRHILENASFYESTVDKLRNKLSQQTAQEPLDTAGNRHPQMRYAGYKGQPLAVQNCTADEVAAYEEGVRAAQPDQQPVKQESRPDPDGYLVTVNSTPTKLFFDLEEATEYVNGFPTEPLDCVIVHDLYTPAPEGDKPCAKKS